ncbi:hypothetical protein [Burkholderia vietnamiensis]|uniref:hypothetical protein n=1 Tax=Burkholderia vietnamiensis TaxID=60552 RepID=UPI001B91D9D1|nr:hypothetical protein [Burkholderia vietnamiensis]MBR8085191.1 hypothetical protein [Burkholderia vietnamiensis]MDN8066318.1 hypothetical protein [Burkholderia vietnamiensis]
MKRIAILLMLLLLGACDPYANNLSGNVKVNTIMAENGVPCVMAVGGGQGGLALSCDWSHQRQRVPN